MKRIIGVLVLLSIGLGIALYFQLERLEAHSVAPTGGSGVIEGVEVDITARIPARILAIHADEGDRVKAGQLLVELDCVESRAALIQARARLAVAEASLQANRAGADAAVLNSRAARTAVVAAESQVGSAVVGLENADRDAQRIASMSRAGAISASRLDLAQTQVANLSHQVAALKANRQTARQRARAAADKVRVAQAQILAAQGQVEAARAAVMRAEALVAECGLSAPRAGAVLSRNFEPGEAVLPGSKVLTVVDLSAVRATFYLPNAELAAAAPEKKVTVRADAYPDKTFAGLIRHVSAKAEFTPRNVQTREDRDRLVYGVEITIPNPDGLLRPGMPVEVSIDGTGRSK